MGTRSGDIDPSVFNYLVACTGKTSEEIYQIMNKKSGFLGVSGVSNDGRDIMKAANEGNKHAILANKIFVRRALDYIGQYYVRLGGCDLIIFSAGIGENSDYYREKICEGLNEAFGVEIDKKLNETIHGKEAVISTPNSKIKVVIIPTDEEVMIARDAYSLLKKKGNQ